MKSKVKNGITVLAIVLLLGVGFVAANGLGIGHQFGTLSDTNKEAMKSNMDAIKTAIKDNNYAAWEAAMNEQIKMLQDQVTEANFNQLVTKDKEMSEVQAKIKAAKDAGDTETLKQLQEQYGFGKGMSGNGRGPGMRHGNCPDCQEPVAEELAE